MRRDAAGRRWGVYRTGRLPDGLGYQGTYYVGPGDTGFTVWDTRFGRVGVGICWDQWYPETARAMMLQGAEVLMYPTAIGSEPHDDELDTAEPWRRAMQGPAVRTVHPHVRAPPTRPAPELAPNTTSRRHGYVAGRHESARHTRALRAARRSSDGGRDATWRAAPVAA